MNPTEIARRSRIKEFLRPKKATLIDFLDEAIMARALTKSKKEFIIKELERLSVVSDQIAVLKEGHYKLQEQEKILALVSESQSRMRQLQQESSEKLVHKQLKQWSNFLSIIGQTITLSQIETIKE